MTATGREVALEVPHDVTAPTTARHFVLAHLTDRPRDVCDDVALLVSELVTNAVRYGRPAVTIRLLVEPASVRVEIHDGGAGLPQLPSAPPEPGRPSGRGLLIVDALATHWGVAPADHETGKTVWFEVAAA